MKISLKLPILFFPILRCQILCGSPLQSELECRHVLNCRVLVVCASSHSLLLPTTHKFLAASFTLPRILIHYCWLNVGFFFFHFETFQRVFLKRNSDNNNISKLCIKSTWLISSSVTIWRIHRPVPSYTTLVCTTINW